MRMHAISRCLHAVGNDHNVLACVVRFLNPDQNLQRELAWCSTTLMARESRDNICIYGTSQIATSLSNARLTGTRHAGQG